MDPKPYGPKRISQVRQIALPTELMSKYGLVIGDEVYFVDLGDAVLLVPEGALKPLLRSLHPKAKRVIKR